MSIIFNAEEIFDIAIQIEKNGAEFYKKASENTEETQAKKILMDLVNMELAHEKIFISLKKELLKNETEKTVFDPYDELAQYLKAFADGHVFNLSNPTDLLTGNESLNDVFKIAIQLEKDSIVLYLGMKELVPGDYGKDKIDKIIGQEMGHIRILSKQMQTVD